MNDGIVLISVVEEVKGIGNDIPGTMDLLVEIDGSITDDSPKLRVVVGAGVVTGLLSMIGPKSDMTGLLPSCDDIVSLV